MIRPVAALRMPVVPVLATVLPLMVLAWPLAPASAAQPSGSAVTVKGSVDKAVDEPDPLTLSIDSMTPSVVPRRGPITMTGQVTNNSLDQWREIKIYPRIARSPLSTIAEVDLAAESDPRLPFGDRITATEAIDDSVTVLEPGQSSTWTVRIPRDHLAGLTGSEGAYQIGVQALGETTGGRPANAIGRARTFIPLMNAGHKKVPTSIVVPVRGPVRRHADGRLTDEDGWASALDHDGRLTHLNDLVGGAGDLPVTWLVDPAVLSAVGQLAAGNPARQLAAPDAESEETATEDPDGDDPTPTGPAKAWLEEFTSLTGPNEVLSLPYGDLDVAAASSYDPSIYELAREAADQAFAELKVSTLPAVAPPSGLLPANALATLEPTATMLMSTEAIPGATTSDENPSRLELGDHSMAVYDPSLAIAPEGDVQNALTLRQRVLAEASVRSLTESDEAFVVNLPSDFDPGAGAEEFFSGLERPFLDVRALSDNTGGGSLEVDGIDYPQRQALRELGPSLFAGARNLIKAGDTLDSIVVGNDTIAARTTAEALTSTSYMVRDEQAAAELRARNATNWLTTRLGLVTIEAPSFVILSAASGPFSVKITNGLDVPVTLAIVAHTRDELEIRAPGEIELEANASRSIQLDATANSIGVHPVDLMATDLEGRELGSSEEMSVRSNSVGKLIWVILGVGVGILFLAIPLRLYRRFRKSRTTA